MSLVSTALYALAALHILLGVPAMVAPEQVRSRVPTRYADAVGDENAWRGFGAGVVSIGGALFIVAGSLGA